MGQHFCKVHYFTLPRDLRAKIQDCKRYGGGMNLVKLLEEARAYLKRFAK